MGQKITLETVYNDFVVVNLQEKLHDWMISVKSSIDRTAKNYKEQEYVLTEGEYSVSCVGHLFLIV